MYSDERLYENRAFEAALWGMPTVNFAAMRRAYLQDIGAEYNDLMVFSDVATWKMQVTTPNNANCYAMFFADLRNGPIVVDIPESSKTELFGTIIDSWNFPIADVGIDGLDKSNGGKYLFFPPDYEGSFPEGYYAFKSPTYGIYSLFRSTQKDKTHEARKYVRQFYKGVSVYPLHAPEKAGAHVDGLDKTFEGIAPYNAEFYSMLDQMVKEEPTRERDLVFLQILHYIGIGKETAFRPDDAHKALLEKVVQDAHAFMMQEEINCDWTFYPGTQWKRLAGRIFAMTGKSCILPDRLDYDARAAGFFAFFGAPCKVPPNLYLKSHADAAGELLNGSNVYRLSVPAHCPTTQFWSLNTYANDTTAFLRGIAVVGLDTLNNDLVYNEDGTADFYLCAAQPSVRCNWLPTIPGKEYFVIFRNYVPQPGVIEGNHPWSLPDIQRM